MICECKISNDHSSLAVCWWLIGYHRIFVTWYGYVPLSNAKKNTRTRRHMSHECPFYGKPNSVLFREGEPKLTPWPSLSQARPLIWENSRQFLRAPGHGASEISCSSPRAHTAQRLREAAEAATAGSAPSAGARGHAIGWRARDGMD